MPRRFPALVTAVIGLVLGACCASASAGLIRTPPGPAVVPRTQQAAIYDLFGLDRNNNQILATIQQHLSQEGYDVKLYRDSTEGAGGQGGATLANFVKLAKTASVIVIDTHGTDFSGNSQVCNKGKGVARVAAGGDTVQICSKHGQQAVQQVEWYPTMAALHRAYTRYVTVGGYKKAWLYESPDDLPATTLVPPRRGDDTIPGFKLYGFRPWLGLTTSGIAHFFGGRKIDLIDNQACHSMAFASSYDASAYLGHASTACTPYEAKDEPLLFGRLTGHDNVRVRSVVDAFSLGGFADPFFDLLATKNVVLSPAIESASPGEGGTLTVGAANASMLDFDAKMDTSSPGSVVSITGCGATISDATWNGDGTSLSYTVNVPKEAVGGAATLTVHAKAATGGDNAELDGNEQPADNGDGGVEPNGDDYVVHLVCHARTFPVKVDYAGTYTDDYTNPTLHFSWHETFTWDESQTYRVQYTDGQFSSESDPSTVTGSGTLSTTGGSPDDSCTIASIPGVAARMSISSGQVNGFGGASPVYVASFFAPAPLATQGSGATLQVTGSADDCYLDTSSGIAPYLYYHPENQAFDPGGLLRTAWYGSLPNVDLGALVNGAFAMPFNADYSETDPLGGSDHVVLKATATVSLTGAPSGIG
jgi:hypothetical protein